MISFATIIKLTLVGLLLFLSVFSAAPMESLFLLMLPGRAPASTNSRRLLSRSKIDIELSSQLSANSEFSCFAKNSLDSNAA